MVFVDFFLLLPFGDFHINCMSFVMGMPGHAICALFLPIMGSK